MLTFKQGDWVKQRNGKVVGPVSITNHGMLQVPVEKREKGLWYPSGHYFLTEEDCRDFVQVVSQPLPLPEPMQRVVVFEDNRWYNTYSSGVDEATLNYASKAVPRSRFFRATVTFTEEITP